MKKTTRGLVCSLFAILFFSMIVHAEGGSHVGNGGDAVVCRSQDGTIQRAEIADYYEARTVYEMAIDLGPANLTWQERVRWGGNRIRRLAPSRWETMLNRANAFLAEARFITGAELPDVPDTGGIVVPIGCKIEQVAVQREPQFPQERRYLINKDIWDSMDSISQAGMVLHELIYREALEQGAKDSRASRYLNAIYSSQEAERLSFPEYLQMLSVAGFANTDLSIPTGDSSWVSSPMKFSVSNKKDYGFGIEFYLKTDLWVDTQTTEGDSVRMKLSARSPHEIFFEFPKALGDSASLRWVLQPSEMELNGQNFKGVIKSAAVVFDEIGRVERFTSAKELFDFFYPYLHNWFIRWEGKGTIRSPQFREPDIDIEYFSIDSTAVSTFEISTRYFYEQKVLSFGLGVDSFAIRYFKKRYILKRMVKCDGMSDTNNYASFQGEEVGITFDHHVSECYEIKVE